MSAANYIHTIRYLKPEQIYGLFLSRYPRQVRSDAAALEIRPVLGTWQPPIQPPAVQTGPASFRLATGDRNVIGAQGWDDSNTPKLWLYNLHYFDDLVAVAAHDRRDWHLDLIARWIVENPPGRGIGWEPYPTSCRVVNWIKWALAGGPLSAEALASLALQARHLRSNLEWRLMANHLFGNIKALVFAGCFFHGKEAEAWLGAGLRLLERQLSQQVLTDGGHCEQSPMYHSIILSDLLDLVNIARAYPRCVPASSAQRWMSTCRAMFGWLDRMCHPDGRTSFFSDGGFTSFDPDSLWRYAERLGLDLAIPPMQPLCHLKPSGYVRLQTRDTVVIFDVGEIGPEYQPGHGHADTLSFELSHKGRRILVNSGTSTYTDGPEREWQRSTAAHNTVEVDGENQSELWGAFRVARRARPLGVRTEETLDLLVAEGAHDGYRRLRPPLTHRRRMELADGFLQIQDTLEGAGHHRASLWFHVHPNLTVHETGRALTIKGENTLVTIEPDPLLAGSIENGSYNPRFGVSEPNLAIRGNWSGTCPVSFITRIRLA